MVHISQRTLGEDEGKQLVETTRDLGRQKLFPGVEHAHDVLLRRHQTVLQLLSREEVLDDQVVRVARVPDENEVVRAEAALLQHPRQLPWSDDRHATGLAVVGRELAPGLPV